MKKFLELLGVLAIFLFLLVPSAIFGQWWLFSAFLIFGIIFGLTEWLSTIKTGKTISQQFWVFKREHPIKAYIILGGMAIAWIFLLIHLGIHN